MAARNSTETKARQLKDQYALLYAGQLSKRELLDRVQEELASIAPISYGSSLEEDYEDYYGAESGPAYTIADIIQTKPLQKAIRRQLCSYTIVIIHFVCSTIKLTCLLFQWICVLLEMVWLIRLQNFNQSA